MKSPECRVPGALGFLLLAALMPAACTRSDGDPRLSPPLVSVAVVKSPAPSRRGYTGVVVARVQSDLGFRVPGKIVARMVDAGQIVSRGQPLMSIDRTDYVLAAAARASAAKAARARALRTAADEKRGRELLAAGAMSASAYDLAKASADSAAADLSAAVAQLDVARREAGYAVLTADADGVIVDAMGEPGQVVAAGQTVVRLARSGPREAEVDLPETFRPTVGSTAHARLYDRQGLYPAKLRQISSEADPRTRTFDARYVLEGAAADAPLGATVTILVVDPPGSWTTPVPWSALHDSGEGPGIWVVEGRKPRVTWRPVRIAGFGEESTTLCAGLMPGELFVTVGAHLLHEGEQVRIAARGDWTQ